jgi:hypothetical protein
MLMEAAVVPLNAIDGPEELKILAEAYSNYDWDLRRAIAATTVGQELYPDDPEFGELLEEYTKDAD